MLRATAVTRRPLAAIAMACVILALGGAARAQGAPPSVEACASASEKAQALRNDHKLRSARDELLRCAQPACPGVIKRDCEELLAQVDQRIPTIVLSVKDALGHDVIDARVTVDGSALTDATAGRAIPLDPGAHVVRVDRGGSTAIEQTIVAREGEKERGIVLRLAPSPAAGSSGATESPTTSRAAPTPWVGYALAGVGIVALGAFGYFAVSGQSDYNHCVDQRCSQSDVDALERKRWLSWGALGAGVIALPLAAFLLVTNGQRAAHPNGVLRASR